MRRIYDPDKINSYLTQPDILPAFFKVKGDIKQHKDVCFLEGEVGLFVCVRLGDSWSCHAAIPEGARGRDALKDGRAVVKWLFDNTDCKKVTTRADRSKKHLLHYNGKILNRSGSDEKYIYYEVTR